MQRSFREEERSTTSARARTPLVRSLTGEATGNGRPLLLGEGEDIVCPCMRVQDGVLAHLLCRAAQANGHSGQEDFDGKLLAVYKLL